MKMDFQLSTHCKKDRVDRLTFIMLNTGLGEIFCEYVADDYLLYRLTTTGVLMVINPVTKTLITAYYTNEEKACAIMNSSPNKFKSSNSLYKTIKNNRAKNLIKKQDEVSY